jgi:hypothetical protein
LNGDELDGERIQGRFADDLNPPFDGIAYQFLPLVLA